MDEAVELVLDLVGLDDLAAGLESADAVTSELPPSSEVIDGVGVRRCTLKVKRYLRTFMPTSVYSGSGGNAAIFWFMYLGILQFDEFFFLKNFGDVTLLITGTDLARKSSSRAL